jgi:ferrochelatase
VLVGGTHPAFVEVCASSSSLLPVYFSLSKSKLGCFPEYRSGFQKNLKRVIATPCFSSPPLRSQCLDPYVLEVSVTVSAVIDRLGHANLYRLAWQSQVGPSAWMGPQTMDALKGLMRLGKKRVLCLSLSHSRVITRSHRDTIRAQSQIWEGGA